MRVVLDTNVLISALFWKGNERRLLEAVLDGDHTLVLCPCILDELERVLRLKFGYPAEGTRAYVGTLYLAAQIATPSSRLTVIAADPSDDRVLECALEGEADTIATGDRHLLTLGSFRKVRIERPAQVLSRL